MFPPIHLFKSFATRRRPCTLNIEKQQTSPIFTTFETMKLLDGGTSNSLLDHSHPLIPATPPPIYNPIHHRGRSESRGKSPRPSRSSPSCQLCKETSLLVFPPTSSPSNNATTNTPPYYVCTVTCCDSANCQPTSKLVMNIDRYSSLSDSAHSYRRSTSPPPPSFLSNGLNGKSSYSKDKTMNNGNGRDSVGKRNHRHRKRATNKLKLVVKPNDGYFGIPLRAPESPLSHARPLSENSSYGHFHRRNSSQSPLIGRSLGSQSMKLYSPETPPPPPSKVSVMNQKGDAGSCRCNTVYSAPIDGSSRFQCSSLSSTPLVNTTATGLDLSLTENTRSTPLCPSTNSFVSPDVDSIKFNASSFPPPSLTQSSIGQQKPRSHFSSSSSHMSTPSPSSLIQSSRFPPPPPTPRRPSPLCSNQTTNIVSHQNSPEYNFFFGDPNKHGFFRKAVPALPIALAVMLCFMNLLLPGSGKESFDVRTFSKS